MSSSSGGQRRFPHTGHETAARAYDTMIAAFAMANGLAAYTGKPATALVSMGSK